MPGKVTSAPRASAATSTGPSPPSPAPAPPDGGGGGGPDPIEAALDQLGPFGLYQRYVVFLMCIPNILGAMYSLNYVFVAGEVPFRCVVPECEGWSPPFEQEAAQALLPAAEACERFQPLDGANHTCAREHYHQLLTQRCDAFVYQNHDTIFAEFGLACRNHLRTLVGTIRNSALPFALILTGFLSDMYGRRTAFCILSGFAGALGILKAFSVNYNMYVSVEFFEALLGYGFNSAGYVMVVELARPSLRAAFACATGVAYGVGGMVFALVAWAVPHWRHLLWTVHAPALLLPTYWLLVDESPRWLHSKQRSDDAAAIIKKAARINKVKLNDDVMKALKVDTKKLDTKISPNPWLKLIKSRALVVRFVACCWCWVAAAFVYYGLTINSVSLSGDKYVNFALNMAMEVVASLLIMMALERFGRKWSIFTAFMLCGLACVIPFFISHTGTGLGLFFVGKLSVSFAFNSLYVFTAELFPTATRSSALAACSLVGRLGSILAPQTPLLSLYIQALLYGAASLTAALAVLAVPETRRAPLPASVAAAETLAPAPPCPPPAPPAPPLPRTLSADV